MADRIADIPAHTIAIWGAKNEPLVTIWPDGRLEYGHDYTPDAAAKVFWECISANAPERHVPCEKLRVAAVNLMNILALKGFVKLPGFPQSDWRP